MEEKELAANKRKRQRVGRKEAEKFVEVFRVGPKEIVALNEEDGQTMKSHKGTVNKAIEKGKRGTAREMESEKKGGGGERRGRGNRGREKKERDKGEKQRTKVANTKGV